MRLNAFPVVQKETYTMHVEGNTVIKPFMSSTYAPTVKGLAATRKIKLPYENPFLLLPRPASVNSIRGISSSTAVGLNLRNLVGKIKFSVTPAVMLKESDLLIGGNGTIALGEKSFWY